jgi:hypothetical protein
MDGHERIWLICATCAGKICTIMGTANELDRDGYKCPDKEQRFRVVMEAVS